MRAIPRSCAPQRRMRTSSVPSPEGATMNASDFRTDRRHLAGRASLGSRLSVGQAFTHRLGPPRLSDACLPDVLTTPTPAEFADSSDLRICKLRPSPVTQGLGVSALSKLTRLIGCGSSSFRPVGSLPACSPSNLAAGQAPVSSVVNRLIRRVGLAPTNYAPFAGCCEWPVYSNGTPRNYSFCFSAARHWTNRSSQTSV